MWLNEAETFDPSVWERLKTLPPPHVPWWRRGELEARRRNGRPTPTTHVWWTPGPVVSREAEWRMISYGGWPGRKRV